MSLLYKKGNMWRKGLILISIPIHSYVFGLLLVCMGFSSCVYDKMLSVDFVIYNQTNNEVVIVESLKNRTLEDILPTGDVNKDEGSFRSSKDTTIIIPPYKKHIESYLLGIFRSNDYVSSETDFALYNIEPMWESVKTVIVSGDTIKKEDYANRNMWFYVEKDGNATFSLYIR